MPKYEFLGPECAYEPEGHDIVVAQLQTGGRLQERTVIYCARETVFEEAQRWFRLYYTDQESIDAGSGQINEIDVLAMDCDMQLLRNLRWGSVLKEVFNDEPRPEIFFGKEENIPVAAILSSTNRPIYQSYGFDLNSYIRSKS